MNNVAARNYRKKVLQVCQELKPMTPDEANERMQLIHLGAIEGAGRNMAHYAEILQHNIRMLQSTPCFETRAEEAIDNAVETLAAALLVAKLAKQSYQRKPLDMPRFVPMQEAAE
jgi:hypothetical protein